MSMTDEEKLAALYVAHEPEEAECVYLLLERDEEENKINLLAVFNEEQSTQAFNYSFAPNRFVKKVEINKLLEGGVDYENRNVTN
jgi:hypothetical protein